jgi:hypothetical protein
MPQKIMQLPHVSFSVVAAISRVWGDFGRVISGLRAHTHSPRTLSVALVDFVRGAIHCTTSLRTLRLACQEITEAADALYGTLSHMSGTDTAPTPFILERAPLCEHSTHRCLLRSKGLELFLVSCSLFTVQVTVRQPDTSINPTCPFVFLHRKYGLPHVDHVHASQQRLQMHTRITSRAHAHHDTA